MNGGRAVFLRLFSDGFRGNGILDQLIIAGADDVDELLDVRVGVMGQDERAQTAEPS